MSIDEYPDFTDRAKQVLRVANSSGITFDQQEISPILILNSLLLENFGSINIVFTRLLTTRMYTFRRKVRAEIPSPLKPNPPPRLKIPLSRESTVVIELARAECNKLNHPKVDAEHLLLGLFLSEDPLVLGVLVQFHVDPGILRRAVIEISPPIALEEDDNPEDRSEDYTTRGE